MAKQLNKDNLVMRATGAIPDKALENAKLDVPTITPPKIEDGYELSKEEKDAIRNDNEVILGCTQAFMNVVVPAYNICKSNPVEIEADAHKLLSEVKFYQIAACTVEDVDDVAEYFGDRIRKVLSAANAANVSVCYGIIGRTDGIKLLIGFKSEGYGGGGSPIEIFKGHFTGARLRDYSFDSTPTYSPQKWATMQAVVPQHEGQKRVTIDYAGLIRSLCGRDFNYFVLAKPRTQVRSAADYGQLLQTMTNCSSAIKHTISLMDGISKAKGTTKGIAIGASAGIGFNQSVGLCMCPFGVGGTASAGMSENFSINATGSLAKQVTDTVTENLTKGIEVTNFRAKELSTFIEAAVDRFRIGQTIGQWDALLTFSAGTDDDFNVLKGYLKAETSRPDKTLLPVSGQVYEKDHIQKLNVKDIENCDVVIPKGYFNPEYDGALRMPMNSDELAALLSLPDRSVSGFSLEKGKFYGVSDPYPPADGGRVGCACDGDREIVNSSFGFSKDDLNKHTFVCGITGCGKTTSVKSLLRSVDVPFLVIECAKKEYRNISGIEPVRVYTPGHPELNSLRFNPFYVLPGVSLHTHVDFLKDLFNASFSFYGPMTYILESALHRVYAKRGWDLTAGEHPSLVKAQSSSDRYNPDHLSRQYGIEEHRYLFPTMSDLLTEVKDYIENELTYDGEVAGNIKSAMLARLEGLCSGAKGFMLNTFDVPNIEELLLKNAVVELEGLADDADKAFSVGLLIIMINEYRLTHPGKGELAHLMVIEEAHRLLKNVATERTSENMGNPKGKAVEHFTNILAEMRSYGQGVIIAEQIPSKIAPDVIKNSSNKIVHRLVARDDQLLLASTIGVSDENAVYFGNQRPGYALCHKEGMSEPVSIHFERESDTPLFDDRVRECVRVNNGGAREMALLYCRILENLPSDIGGRVFKFVNELMLATAYKVNGAEINADEFREHIHGFVDPILARVRNKVKMDKGTLTAALSKVLCDKIMPYFCCGVYATQELPSGLASKMRGALVAPSVEVGNGVSNLVRLFDEDGLSSLDTAGNKVYEVVAAFAVRYYFTHREDEKIDREKLIGAYFMHSLSDNDMFAVRSRIHKAKKTWEEWA